MSSVVLDSWVLTGNERFTGQKFCFAFCGSMELKEYQCRISFREGHSEKYLGKMWVGLLSFYLKIFFPSCDTLIVHVDAANDSAFRSLHTNFKVPVWMPLGINLNTSMESSVRHAWYKDTVKKIADHGYTAEVKVDSGSFNEFYHQMYLPFVKDRHGTSTMAASYADLKHRLPFSELVMIRQDGELQGGCLVDFGHAIPRMLEMGVRAGSRSLVKQGILDAIYYFSIDHIIGKGLTAVSLGNSRGFLNDGALFHKFLVGASFLDHHYAKSGLLHFRVLRKSRGLEEFLIHNPILLSEEGPYFATVFCRLSQLPSPATVSVLRKCQSGNVVARLAVIGGHDDSEQGRAIFEKSVGITDVVDAELAFSV